MSQPKNVLVLLAGSGAKDGSEIHETVLALLNLDEQAIKYQCVAPNICHQPKGKLYF